jgi:hypothetical protein
MSLERRVILPVPLPHSLYHNHTYHGQMYSLRLASRWQWAWREWDFERKIAGCVLILKTHFLNEYILKKRPVELSTDAKVATPLRKERMQPLVQSSNLCLSISIALVTQWSEWGSYEFFFCCFSFCQPMKVTVQMAFLYQSLHWILLIVYWFGKKAKNELCHSSAVDLSPDVKPNNCQSFDTTRKMDSWTKVFLRDPEISIHPETLKNLRYGHFNISSDTTLWFFKIYYL